MNKVDLNRVREFIYLVELGNITRAANSLGERKAKLSRNLALLEKELGAQLVYRTTRQFRLTEAGTQFYHQMKNLIGGADQVIENLTENEEQIAGKIRVTAPEDMGHLLITPIVNDFSKIYPQVHFELIYTNEILDIVKLGIDVAFRIGKLQDSSILQKKLTQLEFILVASPAYLETSKKILNPEDLQEHQVIAFAPNPVDKHIWKMSSPSQKKSIQIKPSFIANNYLTIRDLTRLGRGISFMPRFLAQDGLATGDFVQVLKSWSFEGAPTHIVLPSQKKIAPRIRQFYEFAARYF